MRFARNALALLTAAALTLALAAPVAATQGQPVPFRMHLVGLDRPLNMSPGFPFVRDTFDGRCSVASDWVTTIDSAGTATHLGRVSVVQQHCTQIDIFATPVMPATVTDGWVTITAADGDQLRLEYAGSFLFYPSAQEAGISYITYSQMTVVGGTGRFAGAAGSITGAAVDDWSAGPNTATFSGWIVYDPSVQHD